MKGLAPVKVISLFVRKWVSTDPDYVTPALTAMVRAGGGVPAESIVIITEGAGMLVWEPTGEVKKLR